MKTAGKTGFALVALIALFILFAAADDALAGTWKYNTNAGTRTCVGLTPCTYFDATTGAMKTAAPGTTIAIGGKDPAKWQVFPTYNTLQPHYTDGGRTYDVSDYFLEVKGTLTSDKSRIANSAMITLNPGSILQFADRGGMTNLGVCRGSGTFAGGVSNYGLLSPGLGPGTLTIDGNFRNTSLGTMLFELGSGGFDILKITGTAALDGVLQVVPQGIIKPRRGDSFRIMTWASYTGRFDVIDFSDLPNPGAWTCAYEKTGLTLRYGAVRNR